MINEKKIGKVISVDSFRVYIKLDDDLKSLYKSGYEDIYEVARINSYVIIPNGADRIVAIVTRVRAIDETELNSDKAAIFLTQSARYLVATMIGTIDNNGSYIQGVYNYPVLDNPVWYIIKEDLDKIFDQKDSVDVDYTDDYFLPIGTSPAFADYKIKINPDKFFGKHAAILGNTGSGKSCTVASIIQSLFNYDYRGEELKSAHFIIFDTNGEYKKAFIGYQKKDGEEVEYAKRKSVNTFYIDQSGMKVPYWFMNYDDFDYLFRPSEGTQAPILKRAVSLAKGSDISESSDSIREILVNKIYILFELLGKNDKDMKLFLINDLQDLVDATTGHSNPILTEINSILTTLSAAKLAGKLVENYGIKGTVSTAAVQEAYGKIEIWLNKYWAQSDSSKLKNEKDIDLPKFFHFEKLISTYLDAIIASKDGSKAKLKEYISSLKLRLQSYLNDERIASPLLFKNGEDIQEGLSKFLAFLLGDFAKIYEEANTDLFTQYFVGQNKNEGLENKPSQITIIDMYLISFEVLETITGLIGRLILEFISRFQNNDRGKFPIVIVLEEAQNYIPEKNNGERVSISKKVFERIAREGRKYGISLLVSSQRPSELSKTVLSQCNSFVIHRLQNPEDQKYVRQLISSANEDILQQLPILPQQHAVIMGDAVRTPVQVKINNANPKPNSDNPEFIKNWLEDKGNDFPDYKGISEAWEKGKKYEKLVNEATVSQKKDIVTTFDNSPTSSSDISVDDLPF